jgi:hypothetical protein
VGGPRAFGYEIPRQEMGLRQACIEDGSVSTTSGSAHYCRWVYSIDISSYV